TETAEAPTQLASSLPHATARGSPATTQVMPRNSATGSASLTIVCRGWNTPHDAPAVFSGARTSGGQAPQACRTLLPRPRPAAASRAATAGSEAADVATMMWVVNRERSGRGTARTVGAIDAATRRAPSIDRPEMATTGAPPA